MIFCNFASDDAVNIKLVRVITPLKSTVLVPLDFQPTDVKFALSVFPLISLSFLR